ncbi:MAG: methionyl-tRNA formyltransferase [Bacteroidetes bacterium]|nr:MAG: methionyl-tRNA formyltransferase [Bacteroidota bacterium]
MRIIFLGTPDFAVPILEALVENATQSPVYEVVAVVTAPDKPAGRGYKLTPSPIKETALKYNLPVLQPTNLKAPEFLEELRSYQADLQIIVAFRMLPEAVWNMPPLGTFNLHASLLPKYRGAAPINWAIINGETETGLTTFFLKQEIDTGNIIFQEPEPILPADNVGKLYDRLKHKGAELVMRTLRGIQAGEYPQIPQDLSIPATPAPKIFRETCEIKWRALTSAQVHNLVRGLAPHPSAWGVIAGKVYKIAETNLEYVLPTPLPANFHETEEYITDNKTVLAMRTANGFIAIEQLQPEGKKVMPIQAFLAGHKL